MQPVILVRHKILAFQADCLKVKKQTNKKKHYLQFCIKRGPINLREFCPFNREKPSSHFVPFVSF